MEKLMFLNGQWQGGGHPGALWGARELERLYWHDTPHVDAMVSVGERELEMEHRIVGYRTLCRQLEASFEELRGRAWDKLFTVGASCDGDVASIHCVNERYGGDVAVLWVDAHGDLNAPSESVTHLFYGMPLRTLLGESEGTFDHLVTMPLKPEQVIHVGGRALDPPEVDYMRRSGLAVLSGREEDLAERVKAAVRATGKSRIYIHLDLDVLEPLRFCNTPLPERCGLQPETVLELLRELSTSFPMVGFGLYEYTPMGSRCPLLEDLMAFGAAF